MKRTILILLSIINLNIASCTYYSALKKTGKDSIQYILENQDIIKLQTTELIKNTFNFIRIQKLINIDQNKKIIKSYAGVPVEELFLNLFSDIDKFKNSIETINDFINRFLFKRFMPKGEAINNPAFINLFTSIITDFLEESFKPRFNIINPESQKTDLRFETKLKFCLCERAPFVSRILHAALTVLKICNKFNPETKLIITSLGSGDLMQEYLIINQLIKIRFNNLEINLIDTAYTDELYGNRIKYFGRIIASSMEKYSSMQKALKINTYNSHQMYLSDIESDSNLKTDILILFDPDELLVLEKDFEYYNHNMDKYKSVEDFVKTLDTLYSSDIGKAFKKLEECACKPNALRIAFEAHYKAFELNGENLS